MCGMRIGTFMVVPFLPWLILGVSYGAQGNLYIVHFCTRAFLRTGGATNELFPFGFVQLGTNAEQKTDNSPDSSWPLIRWHQTADHGIAPNMWVSEKILMAKNVSRRMNHTFMAAAMDTHDPEVVQFSISIFMCISVSLWCDSSKGQANSGKKTGMVRWMLQVLLA